MNRFRKVYLEISNICNLRCSFCPGTKRKPHVMSESEFTTIAEKLRPYTDFLYFHLMGEPLCHPELARFMEIAGGLEFKVILTTNGTLLSKHQQMLINAPALHKVNISLHAFEANDLAVPFEKYLEDCFRFSVAAQGKKIVALRLWNHGGADRKNAEILEKLKHYFPEPWTTEKRGIRIGEKIYLEHGDKFDWPDLSVESENDRVFCYGLRDQIGILCDGTVVPCCLDHEGDIALGNIHAEPLEQIIGSQRALNIYNGFTNRKACEALCRRCGYAQKRF